MGQNLDGTSMCPLGLKKRSGTSSLEGIMAGSCRQRKPEAVALTAACGTSQAYLPRATLSSSGRSKSTQSGQVQPSPTCLGHLTLAVLKHAQCTLPGTCLMSRRWLTVVKQLQQREAAWEKEQRQPCGPARIQYLIQWHSVCAEDKSPEQMEKQHLAHPHLEEQ